MWPALVPTVGLFASLGAGLWHLLWPEQSSSGHPSLYGIQPGIHTGVTPHQAPLQPKTASGSCLSYVGTRADQNRLGDPSACRKGGPGAGLCPGGHGAARLWIWLSQLVTCSLLWGRTLERGFSFSLLLPRVPCSGSARYAPSFSAWTSLKYEFHSPAHPALSSTSY